MDQLAHVLGKRFLKDDDFLDNLVDALDGVDLVSELSETDSDYYLSEEAVDEEDLELVNSQSGDNVDEKSNEESGSQDQAS